MKASTTQIEGTLLMLDDVTPHVAVVVQAISDGKVMATTLSDENGKYQFVNLRPGQYQLRCQVLGGYVYYKTTDYVLRFTVYGSVTDDSGHILDVQRGETLSEIDFRFAPFKKGTWRNYDTLDGLAGNLVFAIYRDPDGVMWFGTHGVSRYDGKEFINFTTKDGLGLGDVYAVNGDPDGVMWFGTFLGGVSRYDGKEFVNVTVEDGLVPGDVRAIHRDPDGVMWVGTWAGVSRYDGKECVNFTERDGLAHSNIRAIHSDTDGAIWFGTEGGVSRYDGKGFVNFTVEDGLAQSIVNAIYCDPDGAVWFATWGGGVSVYDGAAWTSLDTRDGLAGNNVWLIHQDADGLLWFGTEEGITCYRRNTTPPRAYIVSVITDRTYRLKTEGSDIPAFTSGCWRHYRKRVRPSQLRRWWIL